MAGEQAVELDVEGELLRGYLRPAHYRRLRRHGVEARVHLDILEALRVPGEPVAGLHAARIPVLDEARVGPARGAHQDAPSHNSQTSSPLGGTTSFQPPRPPACGRAVRRPGPVRGAGGVD